MFFDSIFIASAMLAGPYLRTDRAVLQPWIAEVSRPEDVVVFAAASGGSYEAWDGSDVAISPVASPSPASRLRTFDRLLHLVASG